MLALSFLAIASGGPDADEDRERVVSWVATARMVAEAWNASSVPTAYARNTLETAAREIRRAGAHDATLAGEAAAGTDALAAAIARADVGSVRAAAARLDTVMAKLERAP